MPNTKSRAINLSKSVLISYLLTLFLLLMISFLMLQTGMSSSIVSIAVVITYIISAFVGGWFMGKHVEQKRYLWGLIVAMTYFIVYILISLLVKGDAPIRIGDYVKSFLIIAFSGLLGGMLS